MCDQLMKTCLVSALPPLHSGVALYTLGLLSGFGKIKPSFPFVIIVNDSANSEINIRGLKILRNWTRGPKYFFQVLSAIIREKPSVVHFQHEFFLYGGLFSALLFPLLLLLTRILGKKVIVTVHGVVPSACTTTNFAKSFFVTTNFLILKLGLSALTIIIGKFVNIIIVHNNFAKKTLFQDYAIPLKKIQVIPHGVGTNNLEVKHKSYKKIVLFFGNITPSKGIETLISAFEMIKVPNVNLIIAGGAHPRGKKYFSKIKQRIQSSSSSENIILLGYVPDDKIHSLFEQSTITVFPYTYSVSSSGGLAFAIQHKKPIIVTDLPAFTEIIKDNWNGLVIPPKNPEALTKAIEKIITNEELYQKITKGILISYSNLLWSKIAAKTLECYQTCHSPLKE